MKWSELPKEYKDLENNFHKLAKWSDSDIIEDRFSFFYTQQGFDFWWNCHIASALSELPKIPDPKNPYMGIIDEYHTHK